MSLYCRVSGFVLSSLICQEPNVNGWLGRMYPNWLLYSYVNIPKVWCFFMHLFWLKNILKCADFYILLGGKDNSQNQPYLSCPSQANIMSKHVNRSSCVTVKRLALAYHTLCYKGSEDSIQLRSFILKIQCLQCFDAVGWAAGRTSGL